MTVIDPVVKFSWFDEGDPIALKDYSQCESEYGLYLLCEDNDSSETDLEKRYLERYIGRAFGSTLKARLSKHYNNSHNDKVKANRGKLLFLTKSFDTIDETRYIEALEIAKMDERFSYNKRNEWKEHWALEK